MNLKYCKDCDKSYPNDKKFCSDCGKKLTELIEKPVKEVKAITQREVVPWKKIILVIVAIGLVILVGKLTGFITLPVGDKTTTTTYGSEIACNKPYIRLGKECCLDANSNNICDKDEPKPDCPYQCCVNDDYKPKQCPYNEDCINNRCVKKECPYECCDGTTYQPKPCSSGYECVNNKCEEIKIPKLSLTIDGCENDWDILPPMRREVTNVFATVTNHGTKDAINVQITADANDKVSEYKESGTIGMLPAGVSFQFKLTIDTDYGVDTVVSVTANCDECSPKSITSKDANCQTDWGKQKGRVEEWADLGGKFVDIVK